jgi:predicted amidohydrolase
MRVALGQLDCRVGDKRANVKRLQGAIAEARAAGADLLVVPELQLSGYALSPADTDTATSVDELSRVLSGSGLATLVGFYERTDSADHNSAAYFEDDALVHLHRKLYLCDYPPFGEDALFAPGESMRAFDTALGRMATLICNDAWQPFLPPLAVHDGARVLLIPAASTTVTPDIERYWRELTRFYARMLECYVVFVNRVGTEAEFRFWGGSHVVDPAGDTVAEIESDEEAIVVAELDLDRVDARRRALPLVRDLRPELLRAELGRLASNGTR